MTKQETTTAVRTGQFVKSFTPTDGINARSHRKENHFMEEITVHSFEDGKFFTPVTLRIYGTMAMNYACLWVHSQQANIYCSGSGKAGGYGYHRPSQAAAEAIEKAGFDLNEDIGGRGETAIEDALKAIADHLGIKTYTIHRAHP